MRGGNRGAVASEDEHAGTLGPVNLPVCAQLFERNQFPCADNFRVTSKTEVNGGAADRLPDCP